MHNKLRTISIVTLALAIIASLVTLLVPAPTNINPSSFHSLSLITTFMIITHFGAALLFWLGLGGFTMRFKAAYKWLVVGFITLAIGFIQLPLMVLLDLNDSAFSRYGLIALPFVMSVACIYIGVRRFARLFGVRNVLTSAWKAFGLAVVVAGLSTLLPHSQPNIDIPATTIVVSKFAVMLPAAFNLWTTILGFQVRKRAGTLYIPATAWLVIYLALDSVSSIFGFVARIIEPGQNLVFDAGYGYILYAVAGVVLLKAGVEFNKIGLGQTTTLPASELTFFGRPKAQATGYASDDLPDIISYTAGLSSDIQAIDPILDEVRAVTAGHDSGEPFSVPQQQRLAHTYLRLEAYLADQEPVRPIMRSELRSSIERRFAPLLAQSPTFTQTINTPSPIPIETNKNPMQHNSPLASPDI